MQLSTFAVAAVLALGPLVSAAPPPPAPGAPAPPGPPGPPPAGPAPGPVKPGKSADIPNGVFSFKSAAAKQYYVPRDIPTVPFKVPESWAGLMPIDAKNKSKGELFFWMYPSESKVGKDDVTIWLNGGPGCSSLEGLLQENGPYLFPWNVTGQAPEPYVKPNPYSWHKLSTLIAVEQPLTTGFSTGQVTNTNEKDVARDFYGFLVNLYTTFPELKGKRLWIAGESYAGKYIPNLASHILSQPSSNKEHGISLSGIAINDPSFSSDFFLEDAPAIPFAKTFQKDMRLSDAFIQKLDADAAKHNFTDFVGKNLVYPPPKGGIKKPAAVAADTNYSPWNDIYTEAANNNADFNVYNVKTSFPTADPLGFPPAASEPSAKNILNDIQGLKALIHAPVNTTWYECTINPVFVNGQDNSPAPDVSVLPA